MKALSRVRFLRYNKEFKVGTFRAMIFNNGHIPGSFGIVLKGEKNILYTSDINMTESLLLGSATLPDCDVDLLIIESTYANTIHPDRRRTERELVEKTLEVVEDGGTVLIPAFSVARSQEILCVFEKYDFPYPIYFDGMGKDVAMRLLNYPFFVRDYHLLRRAIRRAKIVVPRKRKKVAKLHGNVIVTTAGMMNGGPVALYMRHIAMNENNAVFLVGFQVPGTLGRRLLENGEYPLDGRHFKKVRAMIEKFVFSSHSDKLGLLKIVRHYPDARILVVHGERTVAESFVSELRDMGRDAYAPEKGEIIRI